MRSFAASEPLLTKRGYKSGSKSFSISLAMPAKFLGETEAQSVAFRKRNGKWSFKGLKINNEIIDQVLDIKSLM